MSKTIESFKKVARIIVVICLFVLAAFQIINLINIIGSTFFADLVLVLRTVLMMLVYLVPAILRAVKKDKEGLQTMRTLGQNMAWLLKCIEIGKKNGINRPEYEPITFTSFPDGK